MFLRCALLPLAALLAAAAQATAPTDLDWLAGRWCAESDGATVEETWLPPRGGELFGISRTVADGRVVEFEFLRIANVDGQVTYLAQPGGRPPTAFALAAAGSGWVRFENPDHDFPQRIEYRRVDEGLRAEISGPGGEGQEQVIGFDYKRCPG